MEAMKFIKLVLFEKKKPIDVMLRQGAGRSGMNWKTYEMLADLTKYVNYGCRFDVLGCKQYRFRSKKDKEERNAQWKKDYEGKPHPNLMCCCGGCRFSIGYHNTFNVSSIAKVARYYNDKTGFWREDKGCALPRKYRSQVCLRHHCGDLTPTAKLLMRCLGMSEDELYKYFEKTYKKHPCRNRYSWSVYGIVKFFKYEFAKEKKEMKERRKIHEA